MSSFNFTNAAKNLAKANVDFDTLSAKVLLVTAAPNQNHEFRNQLTTELAAGGGYTQGGIAQAFTLDAVDTTNHRQPISYTDITNGWTGATWTGVVGAIIYVNVGTSATDILLHYIEFATVTQPTSGNFSIDYTAPFYLNA